MNTDERIDRLIGIVESLAASVVAHDDSIEAHDRQIDGLIAVAEKHKNQIEGLIAVDEKHKNQIEARDRQLDVLLKLAEEHHRTIANLERQWQAYLTRIAPI